ncbi:hypothetical protein SO802_006046, partial [Lithocarpus litseifolius]
LVVEEGGRYFSLRIFERGKYFMKLVFMGKNAAQWLMKSIEKIAVGISSKLFYTFRDGDTAYTLQQNSNSFGLFILLTEFKVGGSRRSVIIPEGKAKTGWRVFGLELRKMLEPDQYVNGGSGYLKFVAQTRKVSSEIQPFKTFADTVRGHQVQARGRNLPHLSSVSDKGQLHLGEIKGVKQNSVADKLGLNERPVSKPVPLALGGGDEVSRCINADFNLGEKNPVGIKKRFPLKFSSNSNESVYGKERELRKYFWTGKGLIVEVNGEGKRRAAWNHNKGGFKSFQWVTRSQNEHVVGCDNFKETWAQNKEVVGSELNGQQMGFPNLHNSEPIGPVRMAVGESSSLADSRSLTSKAHVSATVVISNALHDASVSQNEDLGQQVEPLMVVDDTTDGGFHDGKSPAPEFQADPVQSHISVSEASSADDSKFLVDPIETMGRLAKPTAAAKCSVFDGFCTGDISRIVDKPETDLAHSMRM